MQVGEVDSYASHPMSPQAYRYLFDKTMGAHDSFDCCWLPCSGALLFESNDQLARYDTALRKLIKEHTDGLSVMRLAQLNAIPDKACLVYFPAFLV